MPEETVCCIICGQPRLAGITICGHFICQECERAVVELRVDDLSYGEIVCKLRQLWLVPNS